MKNNLISIADITEDEIASIITKSLDCLNNPRSYNTKLHNRSVFCLFFEPSTRTLASFVRAAYDLNLNVFNLPIGTSSVEKGETVDDTMANMTALRPDMLIIRHHSTETIKRIAQNNHIPIINAGSGKTDHPTQALTDATVITERFGNIKGLKIMICGDIINSRVARSNILLLKKMGADITLVAPPEMMPQYIECDIRKQYRLHQDIIAEQDVLMFLRIQKERITAAYGVSVNEYKHLCGFRAKHMRYMKPEAIIMHPGPINRNIELSDECINSKHSLILQQTTAGHAVRRILLQQYIA